MTTQDIRRTVFEGLRAVARPGAQRSVGSSYQANFILHGCHPIGDLHGPDAVRTGFWEPLHAAFPDLERRDDIFISGHFVEADWIAATGHYAGTFAADYLGVPANGRLTHLRFGEMYRLGGDGALAEGFVLLDLIGLMRQAGVAPWRRGAGAEERVPAPASQDGLRLAPSDKTETDATFKLLMDMLGALFERDRASMGMERFWSPTMMWYGPGMIGATRGLDGFFRDHQTPWMTAFPDWQDALQAPHFADGHYACYAGWPSIRATHTGPLYGLPPTGHTVDIQVMDIWRREDALLAENWVLLDMPHLFKQLGVDLFALMAQRRADRGSEPADSSGAPEGMR